MARKTVFVWALLAGVGWMFPGCSQGPDSGGPAQSLRPGQAEEAGPVAATDGIDPGPVELSVQISGVTVPSGKPAAGPVAGVGPVDNFGRFRGEGRPDVAPRTVEPARQHSFPDVGVDVDPDVDSKGRWIVFCSTRHNLRADLYLKRVDGVTLTQLTNDSASNVQPAFSPSGRQIAFASDRSGNWDIWLIDVTGRNRVRLTDSPSHELAPTWSPDGRRLAYCAFGKRSGRWELWVTDLSNRATRTFIGFGLFPAWSPEAKVDRIAFQRARQRGAHDFSIWTVDLINGEPRYPTEVVPAAKGWAAICPAWSPDGKRVVFAETALAVRAGARPGRPVVTRSAICAIDADGTNRIRLTEARGVNAHPDWAVEGKVYFTSNRQGRESIFSVTASQPSPVQRALKDAALANQPTAAVPTPP